MNAEFAVALVKQLMLTAITVAAPILIVAMAVGLSISLFQAVTSIQEQTLAFVPKALGVVGVIIVLMPWILRTLVEFTRAVIEKIPQMTS
jgi:flagellar biosynthetic protein FliQ